MILSFFRQTIALVLLLGGTCSGYAQTQPNMLFLLSDDHSVPYLGCYGNPDLQTPYLDSLAGNGIRFTRAYTTAPQCVPSRASLMTGRSVVDIRMTRFSAPLPRDIVTFPEVLREAGYYTGVCGRSYHLDGSDRLTESTEQIFEKHQLVTFPDRLNSVQKVYGPTKQEREPLILEQAQTFLDQIPDETPFFLWVNYFDPHRSFDATEYEPDPQGLTLPEGFPDTKLVREDLAAHYGEINRLDHEIGKLLKELEKRGLRENTVIVFMGDNGAALFRGKGTLFETGLNVPLIISEPERLTKGAVRDELISGEDIAPTLLDVAGEKPVATMTGKSFYPLLLGQPFTEREQVFASRGPHASGLPQHTAGFDLSRCVIGKRYKLIYRALWQMPYTPVDFRGSKMWKELNEKYSNNELSGPYLEDLFGETRPMFALYDLEKDPHEFSNLMGKAEYADIEADLKRKLSEWMIVNQDYLPIPSPELSVK